MNFLRAYGRDIGEARTEKRVLVGTSQKKGTIGLERTFLLTGVRKRKFGKKKKNGRSFR